MAEEWDPGRLPGRAGPWPDTCAGRDRSIDRCSAPAAARGRRHRCQSSDRSINRSADRPSDGRLIDQSRPRRNADVGLGADRAFDRLTPATLPLRLGAPGTTSTLGVNRGWPATCSRGRATSISACQTIARSVSANANVRALPGARCVDCRIVRSVRSIAWSAPMPTSAPVDADVLVLGR